MIGDLCMDHVSFSQLKQVRQCPYSYYLSKILKVEQEENAFSQAGNLVHELLSEWANGSIETVDLPIMWKELYPRRVTAPFPTVMESNGYRRKLYEKCLRYFTKFDGFPGYEIIATEKKFESSIHGEKFIGIIDLVLRNTATGEMEIIDHKSCSLSSFNRSKTEMYRQLLLYSKYVADNYGSFPSSLRFNLFRENVFNERKFKPDDYREAVNWAEETIIEMKNRDLTDWFEVRPNSFYCSELCSCRNSCSYGKGE